MQWTTPTQDDLAATLAAPIVKLMKTAALAKNQGDPLALFLSEAVDEIRIAILGAKLPVSATAGSIPPSLLRECAWLTLENAAARITGLSLGSLQKSKIADARSTLRKVAAGSLPIELPDDPISPNTLTSTSTKTMRVVNSRADRISSAQLRNL